MKAYVTREVRSNYSANPIPPRKPLAHHPPMPSEKETPAAEGPDLKMPETEAPQLGVLPANEALRHRNDC